MTSTTRNRRSTTTPRVRASAAAAPAVKRKCAQRGRGGNGLRSDAAEASLRWIFAPSLRSSDLVRSPDDAPVSDAPLLASTRVPTPHDDRSDRFTAEIYAKSELRILL